MIFINGGQLILEEEEGGLLRPALTVPIELYSDERIKEFEEQNEEALSDF